MSGKTIRSAGTYSLEVQLFLSLLQKYVSISEFGQQISQYFNFWQKNSL